MNLVYDGDVCSNLIFFILCVYNIVFIYFSLIFLDDQWFVAVSTRPPVLCVKSVHHDAIFLVHSCFQLQTTGCLKAPTTMGEYEFLVDLTAF